MFLLRASQCESSDPKYDDLEVEHDACKLEVDESKSKICDLEKNQHLEKIVIFARSLKRKS